MTTYQVTLRNIKNGLGTSMTEACIEASDETEAARLVIAKYAAAGRTVSVLGVKPATAEFLATVAAARARAGR